MKTHTLYVSGTHCSACKILIEDILNEQSDITGAHVDLKKETVEVNTESEQSGEYWARVLSDKIQPHGYTLSAEKKIPEKKSDDVIWKALPLGLLVIALFFMFQRSGILNFGIGGQTTPLTSFIIGLVASVSSCLAVVGSLILSLSAKISQDTTDDKKSMLIFHVSRLITFTLLGGLLGSLGGALGINFTFTALLGLLSSVIVLLLGLNLVGVFSKHNIALPSGIFNFFKKVEHTVYAPLSLGFATFFLPCGFTQSMQVVALSSGSFVAGALIMCAFALGTLPMLTLLSFGSASFAQSKHAPLFFKTVGVVVIGFGMFALLSGLAGLGIIKPLFTI